MKQTIYILTITLLLFSCKKLRQKDTLTVDITVENPINGDPFPGVVYQIHEVKDKFSLGLSVNQKKNLFIREKQMLMAKLIVSLILLKIESKVITFILIILIWMCQMENIT